MDPSGGVAVASFGPRAREPAPSVVVRKDNAERCITPVKQHERPPSPVATPRQPENAALTVTVRRLEQKLEADRRNLELRLQRFERRIEDVACASSASGRWAELQGHVDGLAETVQDLVRRGGSGALGEKARHLTSTTASSAALEEKDLVDLRGRLAAVEAVQHPIDPKLIQQLERAHKQLHSQVDSHDKLLAELAARVVEAEQQAANSLLPRFYEAESLGDGKSIAVGPRQKPPPLLHDGGDAEEGDQMALVPSDADDQDAEPRFIGDEDGDDFWGDDEEEEEKNDLQHFSGAQVFRLDEHELDSMQGQVSDLDARVLNVERGLQDVEKEMHDMWMDQCLKQQVGQVGEQMMRLALAKSQKDSNVELEVEVGALGDDVVALQDKVYGIEQGLEGMSKALARVCEELTRGGDGTALARMQGSSPGACACSGAHVQSEEQSEEDVPSA